jgi:4-hydroxy-4-methyl-2-oxoglutarate aldolase
VNESGFPPTTALADVLSIRDERGVLSPPLLPFTTLGHRAGGRARTVQLEPARAPSGSLEPLYALLDEDLSGQVVVLAGGEAIEAAVWGQILSRAARRAGAQAVVIGGAIRDRVELTDEGIPVWAAFELTVGAVGVAQVAAVDEKVGIGGCAIEHGDTIVVDPSGAVVLASQGVATVLEAARELAAGELALLDALGDGTELTKAYAHKRDVVHRLRGS